MKNYNVLHILELLHIYIEMSREEREDFYEQKCSYYQFFVKAILITACIASLSYLISDYQLNNHSIMPTLIPRFSIFVPMVIYILAEQKVKDYRIKTFLNYCLLNTIVFVTTWAVYFLDDKTHFSEGATIMNLVFLICCLGSRPAAGVIGYAVFFLQILVSHQVNHYENLDVILSMNIPCCVAITMAHILLNLGELDHFLTSKKLEHALITDPLTGVYNRHKMEQLVPENEIIDTKLPITLVMLDIDHFKQVNDTYGHYIGDKVLHYLGRTLRREMSVENVVIRFGGEEFVVFLSGCTAAEGYERMDKFREMISAAKDRPVEFTISVGVVAYSGNFKESIKAADDALYHAKESGRNRVFRNFEFEEQKGL